MWMTDQHQEKSKEGELSLRLSDLTCGNKTQSVFDARLDLIRMLGVMTLEEIL